MSGTPAPVIDLRSDTMTRPTAAMRRAIAEAEVGDEQFGEDPTVCELERRGAELLGQEAAIFLPTATMGNQIALRIHARPGDEVIAEQDAHIVISEQGGIAANAGLQLRALPGERGMLTAEAVREAAFCRDDNHVPRTGLVTIECTHNGAGGVALPPTGIKELAETCRELGLPLHLDGSRLMNAAVALGVPAAELAGSCDTVVLCLSKGLGCPLGALLAGDAGTMRAARREKHRFGGAMRQAGIVAAAGLYALDHHVERLADDHARARRLADGLAAAGVAVIADRVETNFVLIDVTAHGLTPADARERVAAAGVLLSPAVMPGALRAVTYLDVGDDHIDAALERIPAALGPQVDPAQRPPRRSALRGY